MSISKKIASLLHLNQGVVVKSHKLASNQSPIITPKLFDYYYISLLQRDGDYAEPLVQIGDKVLAGQAICKPTNHSALYRHAPTSGIIKDVIYISETHPSGIKAKALQIQADGEDQLHPTITPFHKAIEPLSQISKDELLKRIELAGICGMGGAGYPTEKKLTLNHSVDTLIINGAECEPYITCDDLLMQTYAKEIILGAQAISKILQAKQIIIAIESDKTKAIEQMKIACKDSKDPRFNVQEIPAIYPNGSRQKIAEQVLGICSSSQKRSYQYGFICHNVATAKACHDAVFYHRPLISRLVTLSGDSFKKPAVYHLRIGSALTDILNSAEQLSNTEVIIGGTMMGFAAQKNQQQNIQTIRGETTAVLAFSQLGHNHPQQNCIRCGKCADHCPISLLPQQMYFYTKGEQYDKAEQYKIKDCIECGVCTYVCPSNIPLTTYFSHGKAQIKQLEQKKRQADHAKKLFEAKNKRLERLQQEKEERLALKRQKMAKAAEKNNQDKSDLIKQALERANAKKKQLSNPTKNKSI